MGYRIKKVADMYVSDPRFTESIDKHGSCLAQFMSSAMKASLKT